MLAPSDQSNDMQNLKTKNQVVYDYQDPTIYHYHNHAA